MKFVMVADTPGWCFDRTAQGMIKYHGTEHEWDVVYSFSKNWPRGGVLKALPDADIYRVGGLPLLNWMETHGLLKGRRQQFVPTFASFMDIDRCHELLAGKMHYVAAFIINDQRMIDVAIQLGRPIIYSPDRCDHGIFKPMLGKRPKSGPLRVGWAGSERYWHGVKHVDAIEQACKEVGDIEFVRQDREKDDWKSAQEMADWFNGLDLYMSANMSRTCTPVPTLEAMSCGVPVFTTRCGELWRVIHSTHPSWIIQKPDMRSVQEALERAVNVGRDSLRASAIQLSRRAGRNFVTWECGEARRVTEALAALSQGVQS